MPTETKLPDSLLENSGWGSISLANIDEDPDSPDGAWATASGNNVGTIARVSFPTPTGSPTGVQTFKIYVRKNSASGSGTPTARIDLYENGTLLASGSDQNVTSTTGQMLSQDFDLAATPLGTADGSLVEARFVGTQSGGSPSVRASVDLGAINWDVVNYSAGSSLSRTPADTLGLTDSTMVSYMLSRSQGDTFGLTDHATAAKVPKKFPKAVRVIL